MNVFKKIITAVLFALAASGVRADILGITPTEPLFVVFPSQSLPNAVYDATSDSLTISARVVGIRFNGSNARVTGGTMQISVNIDDAGVVQPGTPTDIVISGNVTIDSVPYSGDLLTGQIQSYGITNASAGDGSETDRIDFLFSKTGGALSDYFGDFDIGVSSLANGVGIGAVLEASTYDGSFQVDWEASKFKANVGRIEREEILGMIGDYVWEDTNGDGIQNDGPTGIDGVDVMLFACENGVPGPMLGNTATANGGLYKFNDVAAGSYAVKFTAPNGFLFTSNNVGNDDAVDSDPIPNQDGTMATTECFDFDPAVLMFDDTWDAGLYQPASLGDFVWNDLDEDGVQDQGEPGVNGVTVTLSVLDCDDDSVTVPNFQTVSTANDGFNDGAYQFTGLMPGCYKVTFSDLPTDFVFTIANQGSDALDSDANVNTGMTGTIELDSGEDDPTNDAGIYLPMTAQLGDFVWTDLNANGIQDGDDLGINGATVQLYSCDGGQPDAPVPGVDPQTTGQAPFSDGGYLFDDLAPGTYAVKFTAPDDSYMFSPANQGDQDLNDDVDSDAVPVGGNPPMGFSQCVTLDVGDVNLTVDAGIFQKAMIGDFVWLDANRDGIQDPGENGINEVLVELFECVAGVKTDPAVASQITVNGGNPPADGYYKFVDLMPGEYAVMFTAPNGLVFSPQDQTNDALDSDADADGNAACTELVSGENDPTWDAGLNEPAAPGINVVKLTNDTDNNTPTGPFIPVEGTVTWTYIVTNTGNEDLRNVVLNDDLGTGVQDTQAVPCFSDDTYQTPSDFLPVGGTLYCILVDDNPGAIAGQYMNTAEVCGEYGDEFEPFTACDDDPDHYYGATASIDIRKQNDDFTGVPGNLPDSRSVGVGSDATFTITVTNTGDLDLTDVVVSDFTIPDPADNSEIDDSDCLRMLNDLPGFMEPDASFTFTCTITNITEDFTNEARVDANAVVPPGYPPIAVDDSDTSAITVLPAAIDIRKQEEGADSRDVVRGSDVDFLITVTNTGQVPLQNVVVTDPLGPDCEATYTDNGGILIVGGVWSYTCTIDNAQENYTNVAKVTGESEAGEMVMDDDPSSVMVLTPLIDIAKQEEGADSRDVVRGSNVDFLITVTNTGQVPLQNVVVTDALGPDCEATYTDNGGILVVGGVWSYSCTIDNAQENYTNVAKVTGESESGEMVMDDDPSSVMVLTPLIDIAKQEEGADSRDVVRGSDVDFLITVTNTGQVPLQNVVVTDALGPDCEATYTDNGGILVVGGVWSYSCTIDNAQENYTNVAKVTGESESGEMVMDDDPSSVMVLTPLIDIAKQEEGADSRDVVRGSNVDFLITVTNTGQVPLQNVVVTDALGPDCEATYTDNGGILVVGGVWSYTCTIDNAQENYTNVAKVTGESESGEMVMDDDPSSIVVLTPLIDIAKQEEGPDSRNVAQGSNVDFLITVTNTGEVPLQNVVVTDPLGPDCEATYTDNGGILVVGGVWSYTCTIDNAQADYTNVAKVTGESESGEMVMDDDPSSIVVLAPAIDIEKATNDRNGVPKDADAPRGPGLLVGTDAVFTYVVTNTGNEPIAGVDVTDDQGVAVVFQGGDTNNNNLLDLDETWTYTGTAVVTKGQYTNKGTVTGSGNETGTDVMDMDPSNHFGLDPQIDIEKATNNQDADAPTGPELPVGSTATFTYVVDNTSNEGIKNVVVTDDAGTPGVPGDDFNPAPVLSGGFNVGDIDQDNVLDFNETWSYTANKVVTAGQYTNVSVVTGLGNNTDKPVTDNDPSNHFGLAPAIDIRKQSEDVNGVPTAADDIRVFTSGSDVSFDIVVKNTGSVDLVNVMVDDGLVASCNPSIGSAFTLAIGEEKAFVCTTNNVVDSFVNEACVEGSTTDGVPVSDCDKSDVEIIDIDIRKEAEGADSREFNAGDDVTFAIVVKNTGDEDLFNVEVTDVEAPQCDNDIGFLAAGATVSYDCTVPAVTAGFENIACVDGFRPAVEGKKVSDCDPSTVVIVENCNLTLDKMCFVTPLPPSSNFACDKPIDSLTMIWTGNSTVWVRAWKGSVGSTSLGVKSVGPDEEVTFTGFAGSPNDVFWEVFSDAGLTNKIGESKFHLSCSDDDMDGPEDCGLPQGNGKDNDSSLLNDWLLEGIVDAKNTLDCTVDTTPVFAEACEFTGEPLPNCDNTNNPDTLTWRYDGGTGGDGDCADSTFYTIVDADGKPHSDFECTTTGSINTGQPITVEDDGGNIYVVNPGKEFTTQRGDINPLFISQGGSTQELAFHTSCSQPLEAQATAGALTLVALDGQRGGREVQYEYTVTNNSSGAVSNIDVTDDKLGDIGSIASLDGNGASMTLYAQAFITATTTNTAMAIGDLVNADDCVAPNDIVTVTVNEPPKSCELNGKPTALEFTLGSGLCSDMDNDQGDKAKCEGDGALADISTVEMTKDANKFDVSLSGDSFVIAYDNPPGDKMPSTIKFRVTDSNGVEHDYEVHTSCSQPLAEGDVIGGLEITEFVPEF